MPGVGIKSLMIIVGRRFQPGDLMMRLVNPAGAEPVNGFLNRHAQADVARVIRLSAWHPLTDAGAAEDDAWPVGCDGAEIGGRFTGLVLQLRGR